MYVGPEIVEAPAEVLDEGMPGDDDTGGAISFQSAHGPESILQPSVVSLDGVVGVELGAMEGPRQQLVEHARVGPVPVRGDFDGLHPGAIDRVGEEPASSLAVSSGRE